MACTQPTLVCGLDGSSDSEALSVFVSRLAWTLGARLELVHVVGAPPHHATATAARCGQTPEQQFGALAAPEGENVQVSERVVPHGDPARRLASIAEEEDASMIVVGTHGCGPVADALVGSVSSRLAADAPCPVLVVPSVIAARVRRQAWLGSTIVCGFDGSAIAWAAAHRAALLAARIGGALRLVSVGPVTVRCPAHVIDWDSAVRELQDAAARCYDAGPLAVCHDVRNGDPAFELERVAAVTASPLLVIGSRGLGPSREALLGAVARRVLQAARRPTLVLPGTSLLAGSVNGR